MVQYRRNRVPGGTYSLTLALRDRGARYLVDHVEILRQSFRQVRATRAFSVDAVVVMPDHLHLLCTLPERDTDYSERVRLIKRYFTQSLIAAGVVRRGIWQPRFWEHTIRDDEDFRRHVDYIHFNPVKHGYVSGVSEWPHSSFHRYVRQGLLRSDWGGDMADVPGEGVGE
ncbi:REP-associated tyrosine transposase [Nevskia soli]|uniref:REP-associated tyrosine transposase n=1 Tax=Nevskia soli TaxID=418856 RepID=UPI000A059D49|nr:transposase [Nevskia soli]